MRINRLFQIMKQFRRETKGAVFVEYLLLLTIVGIGAIAGGFVEDKIGAFKTVRLSLFFLLLLGTGILLAPTEIWFWIFALLVGIFIGPVQSSSRSLVARCAPNEHRAQIFGFYMFAGKSTSFIGPAVYGWLVMFTGIERAGMLVVLAFFILGIIVLG